MSKRICLSTPHMSKEGYELHYIHDAFEKNWIAPLGENVKAFERTVEEYLVGGYATAVISGTAALHLAMLEAGVGKGDLVFCQSLTFAACANAIAYVGAEPVFIDSDEKTWNMDPKALRRAIEIYGVPKAVLAVHLYGNPAKVAEIASICEEHGIIFIEDAAEALGSTYEDKKCGTFGDFGILSFNGNKIITTSGGGMLICREKERAAHALKLATQAREQYPWYVHEEIGYNYRLSNICAGIGRGQMQVLDCRVAQKRAIFDRYRENLRDLPMQFQEQISGACSNRWLSAMVIDKACKVTPEQIMKALAAENIEARYMWKPLHSQPVFASAKYVTAGDISVCDDLFSRGICLPSDTKMSMEDVDRVSSLIRALF